MSNTEPWHNSAHETGKNAQALINAFLHVQNIPFLKNKLRSYWKNIFFALVFH